MREVQHPVPTNRIVCTTAFLPADSLLQVSSSPQPGFFVTTLAPTLISVVVIVLVSVLQVRRVKPGGRRLQIS